jgi:hypothetical protein
MVATTAWAKVVHTLRFVDIWLRRIEETDRKTDGTEKGKEPDTEHELNCLGDARRMVAGMLAQHSFPLSTEHLDLRIIGATAGTIWPYGWFVLTWPSWLWLCFFFSLSFSR